MTFEQEFGVGHSNSAGAIDNVGEITGTDIGYSLVIL